MTLNLNTEYSLGGEFGLTPQDFLEPETNLSWYLPAPGNFIYLDTGRSAIYIALLSIIGRGGKKEAWLPRYCCRSVLMPFKQLGFKLNYYSLGADLQSPFHLPAKLEGETFLFIHYFGKKNKVIVNYLKTIRQHAHFFIIEDRVQALLNSGIKTGDYIIYSFRKFLPVPDGALLIADVPVDGCSPAPPDERFVSSRLIGKLIRHNDNQEIFMDVLARAEEVIDNRIYPREMSFLSHYLLDRTNFSVIAGKRRANFFYLLKAIKSNESLEVSVLFDWLDADEVPLGLPIVVDCASRDILRNFLKSCRIYCPVHWPVDLENNNFADDELKLSKSLLTLPIDQRISFSMLDYLIAKLNLFFNH